MNYKTNFYNKYISSQQVSISIKQDSVDFKSNAPYFNNLIKKFFPKNRDISILDLGCGHGVFIHFLKKKSYTKIKGVDISDEQVQMAKSLGMEEVVLGNIFDYTNTTLEQYDVVILMDVLEHLTNEECMLLLKSIYNILNDNGMLVIHVPNAEGVFGMRIRYGDMTHETAFTASSLSQLFKVIGFSQVNSYEEKPVIHGFISFIRYILFSVLLLPFRLLSLAETGTFSCILSRNLLCIVRK